MINLKYSVTMFTLLISSILVNLNSPVFANITTNEASQQVHVTDPIELDNPIEKVIINKIDQNYMTSTSILNRIVLKHKAIANSKMKKQHILYLRKIITAKVFDSRLKNIVDQYEKDFSKELTPITEYIDVTNIELIKQIKSPSKEFYKEFYNMELSYERLVRSYYSTSEFGIKKYLQRLKMK